MIVAWLCSLRKGCCSHDENNQCLNIHCAGIVCDCRNVTSFWFSRVLHQRSLWEEEGYYIQDSDRWGSLKPQRTGSIVLSLILMRLCPSSVTCDERSFQLVISYVGKSSVFGCKRPLIVYVELEGSIYAEEGQTIHNI